MTDAELIAYLQKELETVDFLLHRYIVRVKNATGQTWLEHDVCPDLMPSELERLRQYEG